MGGSRRGDATKSAGRFVVVGGPDGVGKTSAARALLEGHTGRTAYFHFRPPVRTRMDPLPPEVPGVKIDKGAARRSVTAIVLGWVRIGRNFLWYWLAYLVRVRPSLKAGTLVVGDRWSYGYLTQPFALKYYGPAWLAGIVVAAMPRPDLVAILVAPPEIIHQRKQELSVDEIESELARWKRIRHPRKVLVDTTVPPDQVAAQIERELP